MSFSLPMKYVIKLKQKKIKIKATKTSVTLKGTCD